MPQEVLFDAADLIRCGQDMFVLHGHTCNLAGIEWLRRTLAAQEVRLHVVRTPKVLNPGHLDASMIPLRPGLLLAAQPVVADAEAAFQPGGWQVVQAAEPDDWMSADVDYAGKSGKYIALNLLSVDERTVCCMQHDRAVIEQLRSLGFRVLEVPFKETVSARPPLPCRCRPDRVPASDRVRRRPPLLHRRREAGCAEAVLL